ncbi:cell envelope biogenesis protein TolA [Sphingomonas psychrotolerans]|uniref:Cell envelope biogenesis protein TolA n=1 Tax=Sphingomonas psychrotolerans TaxID=1327635 RepID=A0A2K8MLJ0_9SPHN|nr:cell envelope biogenesis protein TolA [Sphingomonas psychrotolerans]
MTRAEIGGLAIAALGHVALFGLLSVGFLATPNAETLKPQPIEVSITDDAALESSAPQLSSEAPAPQIAPEAGPVEPESAPPEPATAPAAKPEPQPQPAPQPKSQPAPAKAAPAKPAPVPKAAPAKPAPAPNKSVAKPQPNPRAVRPSGLLGAEFERGLTAQATQGKAQTPPATTVGPQVRSALEAEVMRQIKPHWRPPSGADSDKLKTRIIVSLNKDGSLAGAPRVTQTGLTESNRSQAALHKERAIRAVTLAAPFRLPPKFYDAWKTIGPTLYEGL